MSDSLLADLRMVALPFGHKSRHSWRLIDGHAANALNSSLELCARWTVFTTPLAHVAQFQDDEVGPLRGCVLCISEDGTVAVIVMDGFQL
jgi:hypothetical protein